jgi:thiamine-phosphate pyrophosphorylase
MKIVIFTPPDFYPNEAEWLIRLLGLPIYRLHIRKPGWSRKQVAALLDTIPASLRTRIVLHRHYSLLQTYRIPCGYIRFRQILTCQSQRLIDLLREKQILWCTGIHRKEDLAFLRTAPAYLFVSPIFPSLSKKDYAKSWIGGELQAILRESPCPVFALGGVCPETLPKAAEMGFAGAALLGWIWNNTDPVRRAEQILNMAEKLSP